MAHEVLKFGDAITVLPIIHGSGDCALEVRRTMLAEAFDCVAVPLPASFQSAIEEAIEFLPAPTIVTQEESRRFSTEWTPESDALDDDDEPFEVKMPRLVATLLDQFTEANGLETTIRENLKALGHGR